jgi:hypothetical protein
VSVAPGVRLARRVRSEPGREHADAEVGVLVVESAAPEDPQRGTSGPRRRQPSRYGRTMEMKTCFAVATYTLVAACGWADVERDPPDAIGLSYEEDPDFLVLPDDVELGQVTGLAVDSLDRLLVFHRAGAGFDNEVPIEAPTILVFDTETGVLLDSFGEGLFVVPHGLAVDEQDHIWATDARSDLVVELSSTGEVLGSSRGEDR